MTNKEWLLQMDDDDLADFLYEGKEKIKTLADSNGNVYYERIPYSKDDWNKWLKEEHI